MVDTKIANSKVGPDAALNQHSKLAMGVGIQKSSPAPSSSSVKGGGSIAKPAAKNY